MISVTVLLLTISLSVADVFAAITPLPANGKFDYQIGGAYTPASDVVVVSRDRQDSPATGKYNICYVNAFQTQPDETASFWKTPQNDDLLLRKVGGGYFEDPDWAGEILLDTSTDAKRQRIATIINGWILGCKQKGFIAIEPDNLDSYSRSNGRLTEANNLALAQLFVTYAHSQDMAVAQKNTADLGNRGKTVAGFDFAIAEECQRYSECPAYTNVYGNALLEIEYKLTYYNSACTARGSSISVIYRDVDVTPSSSSSYRYQQC